MSNSVKKNFGYNLILTFCNYLFPLITYPYVSRVLGVERIGICNFVDGLVNYFVLFSMLGIGSYGVREIAKCRNDKERRNRVFSNLFVLNLIGTIVSSFILIFCTLTLPALKPYVNFLWIGLIKLFFNMFLVEWFFQGMQEFRYITIRSVIVRFLYVIGVFVFVRNQGDILIYYVLTTSTVVFNSIINWQFSRKYINLEFKGLTLEAFIIPVLVFGYYRILTSMYTSFNVVFLGFVSGDAEVGYFSTATKLYTIIMGIFTAFTTVMIPKVSELLSQGETERLQQIANKTFSTLTIVALPIIIFSLFCAPDIILLLSGPGYEGAYIPFRIVIFLLLIIGTEQIVIQQFLMASSSNKSVFSVSTLGAILGVLLNILLTPRYGAIGSAIAWGVSEIGVLFYGVYLMKKLINIKINYKICIQHLSWSIIYVLPLLALKFFSINNYFNLILSFSLTFITFFVINTFFNKSEVVSNLAGSILRRKI